MTVTVPYAYVLTAGVLAACAAVGALLGMAVTIVRDKA